MNIKEFFNQYKKPILYWFILGMAILIAGGTIWWSWSENLRINNTEMEPVKIMEPRLCGPEPPAACTEGARLTCVNGKWDCREIEEKIDISNWKTYRNEEYGFEVKYPAHYEIYSKLENVIWIVSPNEYNKIISKVGTEVFPISIAIKNYRNLEEINNDEINNLDFKKKEKIIIDGFTAIKFSKGIGMDRDTVYISPKDQRYTIEFRNSIDENIFNQIIFTFKFIE